MTNHESDPLSAETEGSQLDNLHKEVSMTIKRLGLDSDFHVFALEEADYRILYVSDDPEKGYWNVQLDTVYEEVGKSVVGKPYNLNRELSVGVSLGRARYNITDRLTYSSVLLGGPFQAELELIDGSLDDCEPIPEGISKLMEDAIRILPTLSTVLYRTADDE